MKRQFLSKRSRHDARSADRRRKGHITRHDAARNSSAMTMEKKTTTRAGMDAAMTWPDARCLDDRTPRSAAEKLDVESSPESSTVTELASSLRSLDLLHDELLR